MILLIINLCNIYSRIISKIIAHNVKVVYDVFGVAETAKQFQQPQKCGGEKTHKGRKPDWVFS
jgi:hypothetical protein